jgi:hypothetical protein
MYGPLSQLKNKPLTKLLGMFSSEKLSQKKQKTCFCCFFPFWGYLGTPKWTEKGTQRPHMVRMYGPMSTLENKPLTKLVGPFIWEKLSKTSRKQVFMLFVFHFGAIWATKMDPNRYSKVHKWPGRMAQYPNLK